MSLNRALVEFYIQYKLSQRGCSVEALGLRDWSRSEDPVRSEDPLDPVRSEDSVDPVDPLDSDRPQRTERVQDQTDLVLAGAAAETSLETNWTEAGSEQVFRSHPVRSRLHPPPASPSPPPASPAPLPPSADLALLKEALRDSANEFELRFSRAFSDLHRQLHITPASAYQSFENVMDEVFRDGVNWGRVIGLFAFGGALCVQCVDKEMSFLVTRIVDWMSLYLDEHIQEWIDQQGGWARFAEIYGQDAAARSRKSQESFKKWLFAGMTLVTGVVVGSLLAQRRL